MTCTLTKCLDTTYCFEQILEAVPSKTSVVHPLIPSHKSPKCNEQEIPGIAGEVRTNSKETRSPQNCYTCIYLCGSISKDLQSSALCRHRVSSRRPAKSDGERESRESVQSAYLEEEEEEEDKYLVAVILRLCR